MGVFESLMKGVNEAIEYEKGNNKGVNRHKITVAPLVEYKPENIKNIRNGLNLSQQAFASVLGVSKKTIEAWEAGKNIPTGPAKRMIELLEKDSSIIEKFSLISHR